jgi:hypothetical protein
MAQFKFTPTTLFILCCACFSACKKSGSNTVIPTGPLTVSSLSLTSGPYYTLVYINGTGFSSTAAEDQVAFNGKTAQITSATATTLVAAVPKGAGTGNVTVTVNNKTVTGPVFTYQLSCTVSTFAGNDIAQSIDGTGAAASFNNLVAITTDRSGNIYVADGTDNVIRKITPAGVVTTLAGSGQAGFANGTGAAASFNKPAGLVADAAGNVYVADSYNWAIRKITPAGVVTTFAGGAFGAADGTGTATTFWPPYAIAIDASDNLYVVGLKIRKITPAGVVTSLPGTPSGYETGIIVDAGGNFYLSSSPNITEISSTGVTTIVAGSAVGGSADGVGSSASFSVISSIAMFNANYFILTDEFNDLIRVVTPTGVVSTLAGQLGGGDIAFDGLGLHSLFNAPTGVAVDPNGIVYVSDSKLHRIRKLLTE